MGKYQFYFCAGLLLGFLFDCPHSCNPTRLMRLSGPEINLYSNIPFNWPQNMLTVLVDAQNFQTIVDDVRSIYHSLRSCLRSLARRCRPLIFIFLLCSIHNKFHFQSSNFFARPQRADTQEKLPKPFKEIKRIIKLQYIFCCRRSMFQVDKLN